MVIKIREISPKGEKDWEGFVEKVSFESGVARVALTYSAMHEQEGTIHSICCNN